MKKRHAIPLGLLLLVAWWAAGRLYLNQPMPGPVVGSTPTVFEVPQGAQAQGVQPSTPPAPLEERCRVNLPHGQAPVFANARVQLRNLCYPSFALGYFAATRTPLWSAEYLTPERIRAARQTRRVNRFHVDPNLPDDEAAQLSDYVHSGYDRGHLSPSGDQPDAATQLDSFSLANMAPQDPGLNRGPWEELESATRDLALREPLYVITGVRFIGQQIDFLHDRVGVPTTYYKLIYDPARQAAVVFEAPNRPGGQPQPQDVASFERQAGVTFGLGPVSPLDLPVTARSPYRTPETP